MQLIPVVSKFTFEASYEIKAPRQHKGFSCELGLGPTILYLKGWWSRKMETQDLTR